jgi:hypothetical protein
MAGLSSSTTHIKEKGGPRAAFFIEILQSRSRWLI